MAESKNKLRCSSCGNVLNTYLSKSSLYKQTGLLPICKNCIDKEFKYLYDHVCNQEIEKSIYYLCMKLDMPYHTSAFNGAMTQYKSKGGKIHRYYITKINSLRETNGYANDFNSGEKLKFEGGTEGINYDEYESVEVAYLVNKWGKNLSIDDLKWLEEKYNEWEQGYEIDGKNRDLIVTQICFEELFIYKERPQGKDVSKRIKTITTLLKEGNLSPKQETASESAEFNSFPEFIVKVETKEPCYIENPVLKDVDHMEAKIKSLAGAINRTRGKADENTAIFNEEFKDYTIDLTNVDGDTNNG